MIMLALGDGGRLLYTRIPLYSRPAGDAATRCPGRVPRDGPRAMHGPGGWARPGERDASGVLAAPASLTLPGSALHGPGQWPRPSAAYMGMHTSCVKVTPNTTAGLQFWAGLCVDRGAAQHRARAQHAASTALGSSSCIAQAMPILAASQRADVGCECGAKCPSPIVRLECSLHQATRERRELRVCDVEHGERSKGGFGAGP